MNPEFIPGEGVRIDIDGYKVLRWNLKAMVQFEKEAKKILIADKVVTEDSDISFGQILDSYISRPNILDCALTILLEYCSPGIDTTKAIVNCKLSTTDQIQAVYGAGMMATNPYQFQAWMLRQKMAEDQVKKNLEKLKELSEKPEENIGEDLSTEASQKSDLTPESSGNLPQSS